MYCASIVHGWTSKLEARIVSGELRALFWRQLILRIAVEGGKLIYRKRWAKIYRKKWCKPFVLIGLNWFGNSFNWA